MIEKVATTSPGVPGSDETYQLQVTNTGPSDAQDVKVTDSLPAGTSFVSASSGCTAAAETVTCTDADLPAGAGGNVVAWNVTVLIDSAQTGSSTNTATVTSSTPDGNPNNMASVTIPLSAQADLSVLKTADEPTVAVGSDEGYTLTVTNHGPSDAQDVVVTDPLPAGLKFVSASKGCTDTGETVTCTDAVLSGKAGENVVRFDLTVYVEPTVSARIINTATVKTKTPQPLPAGATPDEVLATRRSTAHATATFPVLKVTNTPNRHTVPNGGDVTYTLKLTNTGKGTAFGVKLCDRLPAGATVVIAKGAHLMGGELCWTLAKLAKGRSVVRTKTLKMAARTLTGKVSDPATGTAINTKPAKATARVTVGPAPGPTPEGVTG